MLDHPTKEQSGPRLNGFYVLFLWLVTLGTAPFFDVLLGSMSPSFTGLMDVFSDFPDAYLMWVFLGAALSFPTLVVTYLVWFLLRYTQQAPFRVRLVVMLFALAGILFTDWLLFSGIEALIVLPYALGLLLGGFTLPVTRKNRH